jgi:hypothetical protein
MRRQMDKPVLIHPRPGETVADRTTRRSLMIFRIEGLCYPYSLSEGPILVKG